MDGIVTLEDLLEELVGEIYDDYDRDVAAVQRGADGSLLLPGTFPIHDLPDLGVELAPSREADYTTVAGLVIAAGVTVRSGALNIPVNVAVATSKHGPRVTLLTGFNIGR